MLVKDDCMAIIRKTGMGCSLVYSKLEPHETILTTLIKIDLHKLYNVFILFSVIYQNLSINNLSPIEFLRGCVNVLKKFLKHIHRLKSG